MQPLPTDDRKHQRIERFSQIFSRVNSVLTLRPLKVSTQFSLRNAPAWSTGEEITFNARLLGNLDTPREIAAIKGLDLHEVAHVLYTPRNGSEIGDWVQDKGYFPAYNALEDQRIETLLVGRYPSIKDWLTATMLIHLVETDHFDGSYPLLRGRRYLPVEVRRRSMQEYKHQDKIPLVRSIVDEYRTLLFPQDTERAKHLIEDFHNLLMNDEPEGGEGGDGGTGGGTGGIPNPHGHGDRPHEGAPVSTSRPASKKEQERDRANAERFEEPDEAEDLDDEGDDSGSGDGNDVEADKKSEGADNGGNTASAPQNDSTVTDALNDILEEILTNNEQEIENIARQIKGLPSLTSNDAKEPTKRNAKLSAPDAATVAAARAFGRELERIKTAYDPAWDRQQSAGRLNALRAARGDDITTVYDAWNMGRQDATEIECVIILDNSGSMSGKKADAAYRAMYAIKRSLDRINANTTVLTFSDTAQTLYSRDDKADLFIRDGGVGGGTSATEATRYAVKVLAETDKPVRLFIAITDGEWWQPEEADEAISKMRRSGVLTAFAYIADRNYPITNAHNCETAVTVTDVSKIIGIARGVVRNGISRRLLNA